MSTYVAFGNLGNLLTIAVFAQARQRRNSCSLYLLIMTICNLICLDIGILPIIFSLDYTDIRTKYEIACKLQFYIRHASFQMMRTCKVLACFDRYALSSMSVRIRAFSQYKIAVRLIFITGLFWSLFIIQFASKRSIKNQLCSIHNHFYTLIYTIYYLFFAGIIPPLLILIFSFLLMKNLKQMRTHIQSQSPSRKTTITILRKRDRDLMRMVLIEVLFYFINTMPFSIFLIYRILTKDHIKNKEQKQIELFINYMTQSFLMYFNTVLPFFIYVSTSSSFRRKLTNIFKKLTRSMLKQRAKRFISTAQQHEIDIRLHLLKIDNTE